MSKTKKRIILDVALTAMLVFEMLYQLTGNALHEYVGFAFLACIGAHLVLARKWIASTASLLGTRQLNTRRKVLAVVALLLAVDMGLLAISSVVISNTLWNLGLDLSFMNPGDIWAPIHTATSYGLCAIVGVHLASHWLFFAKHFNIAFDPTRRRAIGQSVNVVAGLGALALGVGGYAQVKELLIANALEQAEGTGGANNDANEAAPSQLSLDGTTPQEKQSTMQDNMQDNMDSTQKDSSAYPQNTQERTHRKGKHGRGSGAQDTNAEGQNTLNESNGQGNGSTNPDGNSNQWGESYNPESSGTQDSGSDEQGTESVQEQPSGSPTGICTLCRKKCSFDNLKCDKPYREGLL
ncbi:MAG: DUF4405 domain-containing protein [Eggerthellaceae bacterium]|nr:DUF4405 domain-containing protein [Eggerthellaceae bacterium]